MSITLKRKIKYFLLDISIYIVSFLIMVYSKYGKLELSETVKSFFWLYLLSWFISFLATRKLKAFTKTEFLFACRPFIVAFFLTAGLLSVFSHLYDLKDVSRVIIAGSLLLAISVELVLLWFKVPIHVFFKSKIRLVQSRKIFILDLSILTWVALFFVYYKMQQNDYEQPSSALILISVFLSWSLSSIISHQFRMNLNENYVKFIWGYIKSYIITISLVASILFMLRITEHLRVITFEGLLLYSFWSFGILTYYYFSKIPKKTDETRLKLLKSTEVSDELVDSEKVIYNGIYSLDTTLSPEFSIRKKLQNDYLKNFPEIFRHIDSFINLESFSEKASYVLRSADPYNIEILKENTMDMVFNLHEFNDIRRLNAYFIQINKKLKKGGLYIGNFEPIKHRHNRFLKKYPYFLAKILYFVDFLWKRVAPKIPLVQKFYFGLTKGKDRAISFAEGMGRLYYSGFDVIKIFEFDYKVFFIAVKVKEPSTDENPSYGPIFKMRRIGKGGELIFVYKLRTMHPYAEYLQEFVYKTSNLAEGGKFKDDFRITSWGKIFRKLWIDELPMIINFIKGELKLVGVRPLSRHYFGLYDQSLRELRIKTKPGLVPPYYADMPKTFEEIMESERKYLSSYFKNPISTDVRYFVKSFFNIIVKKARSG